MFAKQYSTGAADPLEPTRYAEPPDWLQFDDGGHWLIHGNADSAREWKSDPLGYPAAMQGWEGGKSIGVVPASVGVLILDVDKAGWAIASDLADQLGDRLHTPIWFTATRRGWHIMLPTDLLLGNGTFTSAGGARVDIRSVDGYVVVHGDRYLEALTKASRYPLPADAVYDALQEVFNVDEPAAAQARVDKAVEGRAAAPGYVPRFPQTDPTRSPEEQLADRYIELGLIPADKRPGTREAAIAAVNELLGDDEPSPPPTPTPPSPTPTPTPAAKPARARRPKPKRRPTPSRRRRRASSNALDWALERLAATPRGNRDNMILKMCVRLHNKGIGEAEVLEFLAGVRRIYHDVDEQKLDGKFANILRYGYGAG